MLYSLFQLALTILSLTKGTLRSLVITSPATPTKAILNASETNLEEVIRGTVGAIRDTEQEATRDTEGAIRDMEAANKGTGAATKVLEEAIKVKVATVVIKVTDVSDTYLFFLLFF